MSTGLPMLRQMGRTVAYRRASLTDGIIALRRSGICALAHTVGPAKLLVGAEGAARCGAHAGGNRVHCGHRY